MINDVEHLFLRLFILIWCPNRLYDFNTYLIISIKSYHFFDCHFLNYYPLLMLSFILILIFLNQVVMTKI